MANLSEFSLKKTLNCRGRLLELDRPVVMGILNVTPDSFYDGGQHLTTDKALRQAERMLSEGAAILDIGGYSTRPGAADVSESDELQRVLPVIERVAAEFPQAFISVDTFRSRVAEEAIHAGAHLINDISGGDDDARMFSTVAKLKVPYVLMHKQGNVATMQQNPQYVDVVRDIVNTFRPKIHTLNQLGVSDIIIDPGFGFGKTIDHNFEILRRLREFGIFNLPVLAGLSRKSSIYKTLGTTAEHALNGTTVCHTIALLNGAFILRAHDVREANECIQLIQRMYV